MTIARESFESQAIFLLLTASKIHFSHEIMDIYPLLTLYDLFGHNQPAFVCNRLIQEVDFRYVSQEMTAMVSLGLFIAFLLSAAGRSRFFHPFD